MTENFGVYVNGCFHITFANGATVSTTIGVGTYSSNRFQEIPYEILKHQFQITAESAEICIWDKNNNEITPQWKKEAGGEKVVGWQSPEQLLDALNWASKYQG